MIVYTIIVNIEMINMENIITLDNMQQHPDALIKDITDLEKASKDSYDAISLTSGYLSIFLYSPDSSPRGINYIYRIIFELDENQQQNEEQVKKDAILLEDNIRQKFSLHAYSFIEDGKLNIDVWKQYDSITEEEYNNLTIGEVTNEVHQAVEIIKNHRL